MRPARIMVSFALLALWALAAVPAGAQEPKRHHALSLIGEPKYKPGFKHFDYVNPDAPKGGMVRLWTRGSSFNNFNPFVLSGDKPAGIGLLFDQLLVSSLDEASTEYGHVAEWVSYPDDFSSVTFGINPAARFHDGRPVTPEDLIFSLDILKKNSPFHAQYFHNVLKGEKTGERQVTFTFDSKGNRELPLITGQLYVLPKHFWEGRNFAGNLDVPPVGSGPYKVKEFENGKFIVYERFADWWAKDLPQARGQYNFGEIRYDYFQSDDVAFEAFKAGAFDYFVESRAQRWATGYGFDARQKGHVKAERIRIERPVPLQSFVMNVRRKPFQDPRVRQAFMLALDFEWMNKNLFYGQYERVKSYFGSKGLAAEGLPQGRELEILDSVRALVPAEVFKEAPTIPVSDGSGQDRRQLQKAVQLLAAAGYTQKGGQMVSAAGEPLTAEFLVYESSLERIVGPYVATLGRLGIKMSIRVVDAPQYEKRKDKFDFDMIWDTLAQSESPGNEQREFWSSAAAGVEGSRNLVGIKSPGVDKLIDAVIFAKDRPELEAATRALDRVLLMGHYVVPLWHSPFERVAMWDKFGRPAQLPSRSVAFQQVWWYDEAAARKLAEARGR